MALIGNPMDFDRIRQKYESLVYPQGRTQDTNFNRVRDSYSSLLSQPGTDPLTGQPTNMGVLAGQGSQTINQDATQAGEQVQLRFNPATGQTETIIPEYMGGFRSDQQDFLPNTSPFQTIYDVNEGMIDPVTGAPKPDPIVTDPNTGQTTSLLATGGGEGRNRDTTQPDNYNFVGGSFVNTDRLNEDGSIAFGLHGMLPGILGAPGTIARAFTSPARQLATLQNISEMNMKFVGGDDITTFKDNKPTMAANDIARLARDVQDRAERSGDVDTAVDAAKLASGYTGLSRDKAQEAMDAAAAEAEEGGIVNTIGNFFGNLFGGDQGGQDQDRNTGTSTGSAASAGAADARDRAARTGESTSQPKSSSERKDVQDNKARRDAIDKMNRSRSFGPGTGKGQSNTGSRGPGGGGGRGPSTRSGRGQDTSGRGQAGGARGGDNPGNTGGTSRF